MVNRLVFIVALSAVSGCTSYSGTSSGGGYNYQGYSQNPEPLATEIDEKAEYQLMLDLAIMEVKQQNYARAETLLQKLRKINHQDIEVYRMLARTYEGLEKQHLALLAWREIVQMPRHTAEDEGEYARLALVEDQFVIAEEVYLQWLDSNSLVRQVSALNNLGFSRLLQKDFIQARRYFNRALKLDPLNSKALNNLILVDALMGE